MQPGLEQRLERRGIDRGDVADLAEVDQAGAGLDRRAARGGERRCARAETPTAGAPAAASAATTSPCSSPAVAMRSARMRGRVVTRRPSIMTGSSPSTRCSVVGLRAAAVDDDDARAERVHDARAGARSAPCRRRAPAGSPPSLTTNVWPRCRRTWGAAWKRSRSSGFRWSSHELLLAQGLHGLREARGLGRVARPAAARGAGRCGIVAGADQDALGEQRVAHGRRREALLEHQAEQEPGAAHAARTGRRATAFAQRLRGARARSRGTPAEATRRATSAAAARTSGPPPKVEPSVAARACARRGSRATSVRPIGRPPAAPLAVVNRSGTTPKCCAAQGVPEASVAGLDLVEDQRRAVRGRRRAQRLEEAARRLGHAGQRLERLEQHGRDARRRSPRAPPPRRRRARARPRTAARGKAATCRRSRAAAPAVRPWKAPEKTNDLAAAGGVERELERVLVGFGAGVRAEDAPLVAGERRQVRVEGRQELVRAARGRAGWSTKESSPPLLARSPRPRPRSPAPSVLTQWPP